MKKPKEHKPTFVKVTDPEKVKAIAATGKYRPELQFYTRDAEGSIWIEKPCGCVDTSEPGHTHTKMCDTHRHEAFLTRGQVAESNNLDLVGG
jgi:hypothetical protein